MPHNRCVGDTQMYQIHLGGAISWIKGFVNSSNKIVVFINCSHMSCLYSDGLVQNCSNSIALAMELPQSCTKPATWFSTKLLEVNPMNLSIHKTNLVCVPWIHCLHSTSITTVYTASCYILPSYDMKWRYLSCVFHEYIVYILLLSPQCN